MRIVSKRESIILFITIGVVGFSILFNTTLVPVLQKNELLDKKIALSKRKLMSYRRLLSQKEKITNEYSRFFSGAPGQGKQGDASVAELYVLENLAKEEKIRIVEIRPRGGAEEGIAEKKPLFFMRTEGGLDGYVKFIYELENPLSLIRIKSFQLTAKPNAQALEGSFVVAGEDLKKEP
jgi:NhaP-type Na+/H+ or K+/H+ antiporter